MYRKPSDILLGLDRLCEEERRSNPNSIKLGQETLTTLKN